MEQYINQFSGYVQIAQVVKCLQGERATYENSLKSDRDLRSVANTAFDGSKEVRREEEFEQGIEDRAQRKALEVARMANAFHTGWNRMPSVITP